MAVIKKMYPAKKKRDENPVLAALIEADEKRSKRMWDRYNKKFKKITQ